METKILENPLSCDTLLEACPVLLVHIFVNSYTSCRILYLVLVVNPVHFLMGRCIVDGTCLFLCETQSFRMNLICFHLLDEMCTVLYSEMFVSTYKISGLHKLEDFTL